MFYNEVWAYIFLFLLMAVGLLTIRWLIYTNRMSINALLQILIYQAAGILVTAGTMSTYAGIVTVPMLVGQFAWEIYPRPVSFLMFPVLLGNQFYMWFLGQLLMFAGCMFSFYLMTRMWKMTPT